jgi:hypothetical protein
MLLMLCRSWASPGLRRSWQAGDAAAAHRTHRDVYTPLAEVSRRRRTRATARRRRGKQRGQGESRTSRVDRDNGGPRICRPVDKGFSAIIPPNYPWRWSRRSSRALTFRCGVTSTWALPGMLTGSFHLQLESHNFGTPQYTLPLCAIA